jgi:hypothetical protein
VCGGATGFRVSLVFEEVPGTGIAGRGSTCSSMI